MLRTSRAFVLAIAVALTASIAFASVAQATREFTVTPGGAIELGTTEGAVNFVVGERTIECPLTLSGNMRRGPINIGEGRMGEILIASIGVCIGGTMERALIEVRQSWEIVSIGILGTLPEEITGLLFAIKRTKFLFSEIGTARRCLYEGEWGLLVGLRRTGMATYSTIRARLLPAFRFRRVTESNCPTEGHMEGELELTPQTLVFR
jgi:hypothetical protein